MPTATFLNVHPPLRNFCIHPCNKQTNERTKKNERTNADRHKCTLITTDGSNKQHCSCPDMTFLLNSSRLLTSLNSIKTPYTSLVVSSLHTQKAMPRVVHVEYYAHVHCFSLFLPRGRYRLFLTIIVFHPLL